MGQKEKAREIVDQKYRFERTAGASTGEVLAMADRVASGVKGRMGGGFKKKGTRSVGGGEQVVYELMGPGGLVSVATAVLTATPIDQGSRVGFQLDQYLFQKGSLGMKPTINGSAQLDKFVAGLAAELDLMGRP